MTKLDGSAMEWFKIIVPLLINALFVGMYAARLETRVSYHDRAIERLEEQSIEISKFREWMKEEHAVLLQRFKNYEEGSAHHEKNNL